MTHNTTLYQHLYTLYEQPAVPSLVEPMSRRNWPDWPGARHHGRDVTTSSLTVMAEEVLNNVKDERHELEKFFLSRKDTVHNKPTLNEYERFVKAATT